MSLIHRSRSRVAAAVLGAVASWWAILGDAGAQTIIAKYSTPTVNEIVHGGMKMLKDRVEKRVNGKLRIDIYPASQLGAIPRVIEGAQLGTIELVTVPAEFLVGLDTRFGVVSAPGIFDDLRHGQRTMYDPEFKKAFWQLGENKGIHLFRIECTAQAVYVFRKPFAKLEDFGGLKVRAFPSAMEREAFKRLGATVAPMPLDEMVPGLQQGTIDGAKSGATVFTSFKVYNVAKYMVRTRDTLVCPIHFANREWWGKLPGDVRSALEDEAAKVDMLNNEIAVTEDEGGVETWRKNGGEVIELSAADRAELKKRTATVGEAATASDAGAREMYNLMLQAATRTRGKS
jgi:TRAP-type C4-dicarboxylate transport system substrate-binding protein